MRRSRSEATFANLLKSTPTFTAYPAIQPLSLHRNRIASPTYRRHADDGSRQITTSGKRKYPITPVSQETWRAPISCSSPDASGGLRPSNAIPAVAHGRESFTQRPASAIQISGLVPAFQDSRWTVASPRRDLECLPTESGRPRPIRSCRPRSRAVTPTCRRLPTASVTDVGQTRSG